MKILGIDTSSNICSVSLLNNSEVIEELSISDQKTHSENLMPLIDRLLTSHEITLSQIDLIACCIGPGSFTGIRIGIASTKAISEALTIPIIGITSLEGLCYNIPDLDSPVCSMIDAKNDNVYYSVFNKERTLISELKANHIDEVIQDLKPYKNRKLLFVGQGSVLHKEKLKMALGEEISFSNLYYQNQSSISIAKSAFLKYSNGLHESADTLMPLYLRKTQAERMKDKNE